MVFSHVDIFVFIILWGIFKNKCVWRVWPLPTNKYLLFPDFKKPPRSSYKKESSGSPLPAKTELFPFLKQLRDLREKIPYNSPSLYFSVVAFFAPTAEPSPYLRQLHRQTVFHIAQGSALFPRSVYRRYEMRIIVIYVPEKYFTKRFIKRLV